MTPAELAAEIARIMSDRAQRDIAGDEDGVLESEVELAQLIDDNLPALFAALRPPPQPEERIVAWLGEKDAAHQGIAAEMRAAGHPALAAEHTAFAQACRAIGDEIARGKHRAAQSTS